MKNEVIYLCVVKKTTDEDGFSIETESKHAVNAEIKSVRSTEFYQANAIGIKTDKIVCINADDWDALRILYGEPEKVEIGHIGYRIVRSYAKDNYDLELTLSRID